MKSIAIIFSLFIAQLSFANPAMKNTKGTTNCTNYKKFTDITTQEMDKLVKTSEATIIDVNSEESFNKNHIPGSFHFATNEKHLAQHLPEDKNALIVAYCGGKMCTAWQKAAKAACEMGYTNIKHFSEGITGWTKTHKI